jgi:uncharacterized protein (TIGR02679 family)
VNGFADPALERLWREAHGRRQRRGATGNARVTLPSVTAEEAFALDGLAWPGRRRTVLPGTTFTTTLCRLEAAIGAAGGNLDAILTEAIGSAPRDLPAESRARRDRRTAYWTWLDVHPVVRANPGLGEWMANARRVGVPGPADRPLVATALNVIAELPHSPVVARSTLAAHLLPDDNPHGLDSNTALGRLCTTLLSWRHGNADRDLDPIKTRDLWLAHGVEVDPLSCSVLVLGLTPVGATPVARALRALRGQAAVLTYGQLRADPVTWSTSATIFTCENPVVVRAAERALGASCPPLVCTGGWPNAAVLSLLDGLHAAGATIHHHGDRDPSGFAILEYLTERLQTTPWRFTARAAPDEGPRGDRDARFAPVPEELVLDALLADLERAAAR